MKAELKNTSNQVVGQVDLNAALFSAPVNEHVLYEAVKNNLNNKRQGTASTLTRSFVAGTTRKPWKQKGTGRARAGSNKSPLWRGGSVIFGPHPKEWRYEIPRKMKRAAFAGALSRLVQEKKVTVLENFQVAEVSTKSAAAVVRGLTASKKVLVVLDGKNRAEDHKVVLSLRNLAWVKVIPAQAVEVTDLHFTEELIITQGALAVWDARAPKAVAS